MLFCSSLSFKSLMLLFFIYGCSLCTTSSAFGIPTSSQQQQQQQQQTLHKKSTKIRSDASLTADDTSAARTSMMTTLLSPERLWSCLLDSFQEKQQQQQQPPFKWDLSSLWEPHKKQFTATTASVVHKDAVSTDDSSSSASSKNELIDRVCIPDTRSRSSKNIKTQPQDNPLIRFWGALPTPSNTSETFTPAAVNKDSSSAGISNSNTNDIPTPLATQGDWGAYLDDSTGLVYYFNTRNGASQWKSPTPDFPRVKIPRNSKPQPITTVGHWSSYWDQMGTGWLYYFNRQTGQSTWESPFDSFPRVLQKNPVNKEAAEAEASASSSSSGAPLPLATQGDWAAYADSKGCIYYWNCVTQTSQWQPPRNFPAIGSGDSNSAVVTTIETKQSREPWFGQLLQALVQLVQQASQHQHQQQEQRISEEQQQQEAARPKGLFGLFGYQEAKSSKKSPNFFNSFFAELFSKLNEAKLSKPKTANIMGRETEFIGHAQPKQASIKRPMPSFSDLIYQDRKIDNVRYAPTFSIPNPKGRRQHASRRRQQHLTLLENIPRLAQWRPNPDGSVTGRVGNSNKFTDGTLITTSPLSQQNVLLQQQSIVKTVTGNQYYLL